MSGFRAPMNLVQVLERGAAWRPSARDRRHQSHSVPGGSSGCVRAHHAAAARLGEPGRRPPQTLGRRRDRALVVVWPLAWAPPVCTRTRRPAVLRPSRSGRLRVDAPPRHPRPALLSDTVSLQRSTRRPDRAAIPADTAAPAGPSRDARAPDAPGLPQGARVTLNGMPFRGSQGDLPPARTVSPCGQPGSRRTTPGGHHAVRRPRCGSSYRPDRVKEGRTPGRASSMGPYNQDNLCFDTRPCRCR